MLVGSGFRPRRQSSSGGGGGGGGDGAAAAPAASLHRHWEELAPNFTDCIFSPKHLKNCDI